MRIDDLLERATPTATEPPSSESIVATIQTRRRRRQASMAAVVSCLVVAAGFGLLRSADGGRVDAAVDAPSTTTNQDNATSSPTTTMSSTSSTAPALSPSESRTFLAPPPEQQIRFLQDNDLVRSAAQNDGLSNIFTVSRDSVADGAVQVYYLDYIGIEITDGPEEFNEAFADVNVEGSTVRVGSDPQGRSVKAFREWEAGVIAVVGFGLTNDEALAVTLAAEVQSGVLIVDQARIPDGFVLEEPFPLTPSDYSSSLSWTVAEDVQAVLFAGPGLLAQAALESTPASDRTAVIVRGTPGVFAAAVRGQDDATLMWAEDGYRYSLTAAAGEVGVDASALLEIAESLEHIGQAEMLERLGPDYMPNQAETIAGWLDDNPLPAGWDPTPLIHSIPGWQQQVASFTHQYMSCAWGAEWLDAAQAGDTERQGAAFEVLADRPNWSAVVAEDEAVQQQLSPEARDEHSGFWLLQFAEETERLAAASTADEISQIGGEISCGFSKP